MARRRRSANDAAVRVLERELRRRRRPWWVLPAVLLALVALAVIDRRGVLLYEGDDLARYDGKAFEVVRVIDGDTLAVDATDGGADITRVRLWGINTPELDRPDEKAAAEAARDAASRWAAGRRVTLRLEPGRVRDRYGRLLAYVELPDGDLLNERLLEAGLAHADDRWAHARVDRFAALEEAARKRRVGLWSNE